MPILSWTMISPSVRPIPTEMSRRIPFGLLALATLHLFNEDFLLRKSIGGRSHGFK
jgi:hypothetical protein